MRRSTLDSTDIRINDSVPSLGRRGDAVADTTIFLLTVAGAAGAAAGLLASLAGAAGRGLGMPLWPAVPIACLSVLVVSIGCYASFHSVRRVRDSHFVVLLAAVWLLSRISVILLFPHFTLTGDGKYLHDFVVNLASGGLSPENLLRLNSQYDYPVWLSRAFPLYYPLRRVFGGGDVAVLRYLNSAMGAGTMLFAFLIVRRLAGSACARVAAWLFTAFPYHVFDVLSYSPQIPGTLLFVAGAWLSLNVLYGRRTSWPKVLLQGLLIGCVMTGAGIQRGGLDVLLLGAVTAQSGLCILRREPDFQFRRVLAAFALAVLLWWPVRHGVSDWIERHDVNKTRSHELGFLSRGWNLVSLGEYLLRYEQLDASASPQEKQRVLLSTWVTEVVRQPMVTLGVVPIAKAAKFFMLGYSAEAEPGLVEGGYATAALVAVVLRIAFAPLVLALCLLGFVSALKDPEAAWKISFATLSIVIATAAIVLAWETSPRYAHCIHFALLAIAALGVRHVCEKGLREAAHMSRATRVRAAWVVGLASLCWCGFGVAAFAACGRAEKYLYADIRGTTATVDNRAVSVSPLHRWTGAWEQAITLPQGTNLPAVLRLSWPARKAGEPLVSLSIWLLDPPPQPMASSRVAVRPVGGSARMCTFAELAGMRRGVWPALSTGDAQQSVEIVLHPPEGQLQAVLPQSLRLGVGYILEELPANDR